MRSAKRALKAAHRRETCVKAVLEGKTLSEAAKEAGYSGHSGAYSAIIAACSDISARSREQMLEDMRVEVTELKRLLWERITDGSPDHKDAASLVRALVCVWERKAKLFGLDAPSKVDATVKHELPDDPSALKMRLLTVLEGLNANATAPDTGPVDGAGGPPADPGDVDPNKPKL